MSINKLDPVQQRYIYMAGLERVAQFFPGHGFANIEEPENGTIMKCIHVETPDGPCGGMISTGIDADGPHMHCSKCGKIVAKPIKPKTTRILGPEGYPNP